jgi:hypothetical protein
MALSIAPGGQPARRLALSLMLALVLHGITLFFLRFPASPAVAGRKAALEVVLLTAEAPPSADFRDARRDASIAGMVMPTQRRTETPPLSGDYAQPVTSPVRESQPAISAAQLLESARRIIREEAKNNPERGAAKGSGNAVDNTVEAKLARALRAPIAGEKRLDGSLVKITTVLGTTYCLKAPPDRLRDGPVEQISIPTTCP